MLKVAKLVVGQIQENTYVVYNEDNKALVIDPGDDADRIIAWIKGNGWEPEAVLITHTHFDHVLAVDSVRDEFGIEVYVHEIESETFQTPNRNMQPSTVVVNRPADHLWSELGEHTVGSFTFDIALIPGHSPGHVVYTFKEDGFVICGDTVFNGSIGRTDTPGGDLQTLLVGIARDILTLPGDFVLFPGHGGPTTVSQEIQSNPFLQGFKA